MNFLPFTYCALQNSTMITLKSPADISVKNEINLVTYFVLLKFKIDVKEDKKLRYESVKLSNFTKSIEPIFCKHQAAIIANTKFMK